MSRVSFTGEEPDRGALPRFYLLLNCWGFQDQLLSALPLPFLALIHLTLCLSASGIVNNVHIALTWPGSVPSAR